MATTVLYLVRHAEQHHSRAGEDPDGGLTEAGRRQAHRLGLRLADTRFDAVRHSPLRRAEQTARILGTYLPGVPVSVSELLRDRTPVPAPDDIGSVPAAFRPFLDRVPADERDPGA